MSDTQQPQDAHEPQAHGRQEEPRTQGESASAPDVIAPPLAALIATIRAAVGHGASPEARAAGASACRSILMVLEAKPGQPLAVPPQPASAPTSPLMALLSQPGLLSKLAPMSREELLDLLRQVTGAMPTRTRTPASAGPRFHIVEVPRRGPQ